MPARRIADSGPEHTCSPAGRQRAGRGSTGRTG